MPTPKGFTMIELIVVITLISILGVYAQSRFDSGAFEERYFSDDVISSLRFAQKYAIATGCAVQFNLTTTGFHLMAETESECSSATVSSFSRTVKRPWNNEPFVNQAALPPAITLTSTSVVFYPQGWACDATGSDYTTTSIALNGGTNRTINVECNTGFVHQS